MSQRKSPRRYKFNIHYNKPESKRRGVTIWTVHYKGQCHLAENVICSIPIKTKSRSSQPRGVMEGSAAELIQAGRLIELR